MLVPSGKDEVSVGMQKIQRASLGIEFLIGSFHSSKVYNNKLNNWMKIIWLFMFLKVKALPLLNTQKEDLEGK